MKKHVLLIGVPFLLLMAACGSTSSDTESAGESTGSVETLEDSSNVTATTEDTEAGLSCEDTAALFVNAGSANADLPDPEVSATCDGDSIVVTANGIPDYTYIETSPGEPTETNLEFTIPATPTPSDELTDVPALGSAAIATNGVPIYGPTEGQGGDVLSLEGALSDCGSHNGPTGFHIHTFGTSDTTDCIHTTEEVEAEPQLLGYALDGYPIYTGNTFYTSSWELTDESLFASDTWSAHTYVNGSGDLDECNGLTDEDGNYAYYTTDTFPYILGCYRGVVDLDVAGGGVGELDVTGAPGPPPGG